MAVRVKTKPTFSWETPKMMFQGTFASVPRSSMTRNWDVSPDGQRFLLLKPLGPTDQTSTEEGRNKINIVLNWFEELKQRVPVK